MEQIKCPVCNKRACDSNKSLQISKLSNNNIKKADIVIKCKNCKSCLAINVQDKVIWSLTLYIARCLTYEHDKWPSKVACCALFYFLGGENFGNVRTKDRDN